MLSARHRENARIFEAAGGFSPTLGVLGGLALTMDGLKQRDRLVFETALAQNIPVAVVLAGGYARNTSDTVTIHCNTAKAASAVVSNLEQTRVPKLG